MEKSNQEVELKLEIDARVYGELLETFPAEKVVVQDNWFFDTPDGLLRQGLWALRVRFQTDRAIMTTKGPAEQQGGLHIRPEIEESIPVEAARALMSGFRLEEQGFSPCRELAARFGDLSVGTILHFQNRRSLCPREDHLLEIDKSTVGDHSWYELEVEMAAGVDRKAVQLSVEGLFDTRGWAFTYSTTNKFSKALAYSLKHER